jgi:predicted O-linked N-acetylglucosamine transferase (SPINDLY family)
MRSIHRSRAMCEWDEFPEGARLMRSLLAAGAPGKLPPFLLLSEPGMSASEQRACSELWIADRLAASRTARDALGLQFNIRKRKKIRVGYLSSDFHDHATSLLLIETIESHDHARFDIRAYSYGLDDGGEMRRRLRNAFDEFRDISSMSDADAAIAIHRDEIDILVDLKGYTKDTRAGVVMLPPAPVQVNYLGYPGTLGAGVCDYIITDCFITPMSSAANYSESFAYMPHSYQPHGRKMEIAAAAARSEVGLPPAGFVFCCFNQAYKFTPAIFDLWRRLLDSVPGSVLWLSASGVAEGNLRNEMRRRGVDAARLTFAPHRSQAEHMSRLQLADLVLDTSPFGAHTTASDALWAGVPIVTWAGETFPSRVAGSLLHAVGLPELIASDFEQYFDIAFALAKDPLRFAALKAKLAAGKFTAPLFDAAAYTTALEQLYEEMWRRRLAGEPCGAISASSF